MISPTSVRNNSLKEDTSELVFNAQAIAEFLQALGYRKGDTVYLRGFLPSDNPLKTEDKGRKGEAKDIAQLVRIVTDWQKEGRGVYLVVNGGGHTDSKVQNCRAIFYEHDDLDKELQIKLWAMMGLPMPTIQIDTGGKSIHSYWLLDKPIPPEQWKELQSDLLHFVDGDKSLKNPSRVMRIAGCFHISSSGAKESTIVSNSQNKYEFEQLRKLIPQRSQKNLPIQPIPGEIPLYQCLSLSDRQLIDSGAGQGERNSSGAKLARGVIGTANRMTELGHRFSGIPRELFSNFCDHCTPPLEQKEADLIWRSAEKSNPTSTLPDEYLENCVKSWDKSHGQRAKSTAKENEPKSSAKSTAKEKLLKAVDELIDDELSRSEIEAIIPDIAMTLERSPGDVRRIYEARRKEREKNDRRTETLREIPSLLEAQKARLDPFKLFFGDGGKFADLISRTAASMPTSVENLITTLIPAVGSRIGTAGRIIIKPSARYSQPSIFWTCIVAPTGRLKTPAQQVILSALTKLEAEEFKLWKLQKQEFEEEMKFFKRSSSEEPPTPPTPRKRLIIQSATPETRIKIHAENPRGLLYYRDEWSAFINARNKYRGGKGDDLEQDLSEFNGDAILKDNSNESFFLERSALSRTGNTQPETLKAILGQQDFEDYTGEFARWLFCLVPAPVAYIDLFSDDGTGQEIENALLDIFKKVGRIPEQDYFLSTEAKRSFQNYHRFLTDAEVAENHPGMRATYPKLKSYLARLALWLHIFNSVLQGINPPQIIEDFTMEVACVMVDFYLSQAKVLYGDTTGQQITGDLLKVKDFLERKKVATPRDIKQNIFSLKMTPSEDILSIFTTLSELGFCKLEDKKFIFLEKTTNITNKTPKDLSSKGSSVGGSHQRPPTTTNRKSNINLQTQKNQKIVGDVGGMLVVSTNAESDTQQDFQRFVGDVGDFSKLKTTIDEKGSLKIDEKVVEGERNISNISIPETTERGQDKDEVDFIFPISSSPVKIKIDGTYLHKSTKKECTIKTIRGTLNDKAIVLLCDSKDLTEVNIKDLEGCNKSPRWKQGEDVRVVGIKEVFTISSIHNGEIWLKKVNAQKGYLPLGPYTSDVLREVS